MSTDATTPADAPAAEADRQPLSFNERRVLGVLVEKAKTTPDTYPLSMNALITGCNQKNNRDPVTNLAQVDVEAALDELKKKGMVQQITGSGRVDKFRHVVYDLLKVDKVQLAILGELLLRGPQTVGELRGRASRMEPIADLEALRPQLKTLSERGLVVYLSPEGRRGTTVTHGFHAASELSHLRTRTASADTSEEDAPLSRSEARTPAAAHDLTQRVQALEGMVAELRAEVRELKERVSEPRTQVAHRPE